MRRILDERPVREETRSDTTAKELAMGAGRRVPVAKLVAALAAVLALLWLPAAA